MLLLLWHVIVCVFWLFFGKTSWTLSFCPRCFSCSLLDFAHQVSPAVELTHYYVYSKCDGLLTDAVIQCFSKCTHSWSKIIKLRALQLRKTTVWINCEISVMLLFHQNQQVYRVFLKVCVLHKWLHECAGNSCKQKRKEYLESVEETHDVMILPPFKLAGR